MTRPRSVLSAPLVVAAMVLTALVATPASAAPMTFNVTTVDDDADGTCDADCTLREAVIAANANPGQDTIVLPAGTYALTIAGDGEDLAATGDLDLTDSVIIRGDGAATTTIDGGGDGPGNTTTDRVLDMFGKIDVSLQSLTITNGDVNGSGGGVRTGNLDPDGVVLTILDVVVEDNDATVDGGGLNAGNSAVVTILDSTFTGNGGADGGAMELNEASVRIERTDIDDNQATSDGGGIYNNESTVEVVDGSISDNTAGSDGGGAYVDYAAQTVHGTTMDGNTAGEDGGAVDGEYSAIELTDVSLDGNRAESDGGTLAQEYSVMVVTDSPIDNSGLTHDSSMDGGAVMVDYGNLELVRSPISDTTNTTTADGIEGGAVFAYESNLLMVDSPITRTTSSGMTSTSYGGALYCDASLCTEIGDNSITDTTITSASTIDGGAVYVYETALTMTGDEVSDTMATSTGSIYGGAFHVEYGGLTLDDMTIERNVLDTSSTAEGGGIYLSDSGEGLRLTNSRVAENVAGTGGTSGAGGAVYCQDDYGGCTIEDSVLEDNSATEHGGAITLYYAPLILRRSELIGNTAYSPTSPGENTEGGAISGEEDYGAALIEDSLFEGNSATDAGGAIYLYDQPLIMRDTILRNNTVDDREEDGNADGGALELDASPGLIERSVFEGNTAIADGDAEGGAINLDGSALTIRDSAIIDNTATSRNDVEDDDVQGGGIHQSDADSTLRAERVLIAGNSASNLGTMGTEQGGGVYADSATSFFENSTLSDNAAAEGAAVYGDLEAGIRLAHTTVFGNTAEAGSGAIMTEAGGVTAIKASVFEDNSPASCADATPESRGWNVTDDDSCDLDLASDDEDTDALLGPLQFNGGYTDTHLPGDGSPAIDHADNPCLDITGGYEIVMDQRGAGRPGDAACDAGAVEVGVGVTVTATDADASEDGPDTGAFTFARPSTDGDLTVDYAVSGTATPDDDYTALSGSVTFTDGNATVTVDVTPAVDAVDEDDETVTVTLVAGTDYTIAEPDTATVTITDAPDPDPVDPVDPGTFRLAGNDRVLTAVEISMDSYPDADSAGAVVIARSDDFPDALGGTPLAAAVDGPMLLTPSPANIAAFGLDDGLDARSRDELDRVLPNGATVYVLGGPVAVPTSVDSELTLAGYNVERLGGDNRFDTAVLIADEVSADPANVLLTTGLNFPDALAAGAAAAAVDGVVLLTNGTSAAAATAAWLLANPGVTQYAIGGPSATAHPAAQAIVGSTRYETATLTAEEFFDDPIQVGVARGDLFPDALGGGAHIARRGGPLLLSDPTTLTPAGQVAFTRDYLVANAASIEAAHLYGGEVALSATVAVQVSDAIS